MITLTPKAASQIKTLLKEGNTPETEGGLRISIENGGCSGRQYVMTISNRQPHDQVFQSESASLFVDPESLKFIDGSVIDFVDGLNNTGFRIINPNAKQTCGCGTSFEA